MPRRKAAQNCNIRPWLTAKVDCKEGRFIQVGNSFMLSKKVQSLSMGARWLYFAVAMESGGQATVEFPHKAAKKYGIASTSFDRYIRELCTQGLLERVPDDEMAQYAPAVYRFSMEWKVEKVMEYKVQ